MLTCQLPITRIAGAVVLQPQQPPPGKGRGKRRPAKQQHRHAKHQHAWQEMDIFQHNAPDWT